MCWVDNVKLSLSFLSTTTTLYEPKAQLAHLPPPFQTLNTQIVAHADTLVSTFESCITLHLHELDLLHIKLQLLSDVVSFFVVSESCFTQLHFNRSFFTSLF